MYILIKSMVYTYFSNKCFEVLNILLFLVVICIKYENNVDAYIDDRDTTNNNNALFFLIETKLKLPNDI
jgi:hypothetical protein